MILIGFLNVQYTISNDSGYYLPIVFVTKKITILRSPFLDSDSIENCYESLITSKTLGEKYKELATRNKLLTISQFCHVKRHKAEEYTTL